ncbi:type I-E CRISPR-associated protein Cas7/Cse4/CasC [Leucobacter chinensis]|uniref:type I-E CRISPR-associated protein Cas7/Cse4/CasC n=1 Tax=Leucobacter chinensis TaxID=2851010 RepID=UPI001C2338ED|nr:type I-E CRISPR-associated protein Cas7/Cse4/CasC [Leucobacter chinensis]
MSTFIDIHALHTLPPSNINRDDTGAPKSAIYGGVQRQRVSSQSWKRAIRKAFPDYIDAENLGERTRRLGERVFAAAKVISPEVNNSDLQEALIASFKQVKWSLDLVDEEGEEGTAYARSKYLAFFSKRQIEKLATALLNVEPGKPITKKELNEILDTEQSVDIALFGRMIADTPDFNVDAASQVAHAISVHESIAEHDYFTAVDDVIDAEGEESGAGMIGTVEFTSSTLYRYATVHLEGLASNLGDATSAKQATVAFVQAFVTSQPTGKQNTFANQTLPELVIVQVRSDRPVSYVNAFEDPIVETLGRRKIAAERLVNEITAVSDAYGFSADRTLVIGVGELGEVAASIGEPTTFSGLGEMLAEALETSGA